MQERKPRSVENERLAGADEGITRITLPRDPDAAVEDSHAMACVVGQAKQPDFGQRSHCAFAVQVHDIPFRCADAVASAQRLSAVSFAAGGQGGEQLHVRAATEGAWR